MLKWLKVLFRPRARTLRELGYPSHEELASVGLTGAQFFRRYVQPYEPRGDRSPEDMARIILGRFHQDHPKLAPTNWSMRP
jgi:hypothetical protein